MYRIIVSYAHPADPQAFLEHYRSTHAPITKGMAHVSSYVWGVVETLDGSQPEHFVVATLDWPSKDAAMADLGSEAGQRGSADLANFAQAGVTITAVDLETVV